MRVLLDVMGGDLPPRELVKGGVQMARRGGTDIVFAGDSSIIKSALAEHREEPGGRFEILPCSEVVRMDDSPVAAVREKKASSLVRGLESLRDGQVDAFVSPGNTGAVVAGSIFILGRTPGIPRPGLMAALPTVAGEDVYVIDVGANSDSTAEQLLHFALMGATYAREAAKIPHPTVGLLNIGSEEGKGNRLIGKAFSLLDASPLPFEGNVEAHRALIDRPVDVIVSDGFVGNVFLKSVEGGVSALTRLLKRTIRGRAIAMLGALLMSGSIARVRGTMSYQRRGGAPLLGVGGVVVIAHGRSDAEAIGSALDVACHQVKANLIDRFSRGIAGWETDGD
ncbi:phosphate acyltransferase PlsX [Candidatus Bipolaricaulota bacterium]